MKRAFTLIELLVVIAIIAILAAILFPVFAQAKEAAKITAALAQAKQLGTSCMIYSTDADDNFPLSMGKRPNGGTWGSGLVHPFPANSIMDSPWQDPARIDMATTAWGNSTYPYSKNYNIYDVQQATTDSWPAQTVNPASPKTRTVLTMNGLMHGMSQTQIESVSVAVLLWPGNGAGGYVNRTTANPSLDCGTSDDCRFNPAGPPSSTQNIGGNGNLYGSPSNNSIWLFSRRRMPMVRADSSAKSVIAGNTISPSVIAFGNGVLSDPLASVDGSGKSWSYWKCSFDGNGDVIWNPTSNYPCFFRPDRTK